MPTKTLPLPKGEVTEADVLAALREFNRRVDILQARMAERDKQIKQLRKSSRATLARIKKMLGPRPHQNPRLQTTATDTPTPHNAQTVQSLRLIDAAMSTP